MDRRHGPQLSAHDSAFVEQTTPETPMNVGGLITFERHDDPLTVSRLRSLVEPRLDLVPRLRQRIEHEGHRVVLVDDPAFDIRAHVDRLPVDADDAELLRHVSRLHGSALPPGRPPWRIDLVPQGATRGMALLFRASHAVVDGMSSMQVMRALFDPTDATATSGRSGDDLEPGSGTDDLADAVDVVRDVWRTMTPGTDWLEPEQYERALTLLDGWISVLQRGPPSTPRFPAIGDPRPRVAVAELPLREIRRLRTDGRARFDEIGMTLVGGGLARLFAARGTPPPPGDRVRTLVPVAGATRRRRRELGNRASYLIVSLPIAPMEPAERLALVSAEVREALASGQHKAAAMSLRALDTAPAESVQAISAFTRGRHFVDLVVSCVPGWRRPPRLGGITHAVTHPLLPITPHVRVAVGLADVGRRIGLAVTADERALPELDFFVDGITRTARELAGV